MKGDVIKRDCLLMIFVKNPELGKVKTRLAETLGDQKALDVYKSLLQHTRLVAAGVNADKAVFYHEHIEEADLWSDPQFSDATHSSRYTLSPLSQRKIHPSNLDENSRLVSAQDLQIQAHS